MKAIELLGVSKRYGKNTALETVTFDVEPGDAVALIGPNGAGKTTLLRILATLLKPTGGYARVMGLDGRFQAAKIRRLLGYMPDAVAMEPDQTVREYLEFFAGLHGITGAARTSVIEGLVKLLDLQEVGERLCGELSRGMQQRVGLARTLVHNPSILLLDEPAANLDPRARIEIREVLKELRNMGKTILISSHILMELAELCNKIMVMERGKLVYGGLVSEVAGRFTTRRRIAVRIGGDVERVRAALQGEADVEAVAVSDGWLAIQLKEGREDYSFVARRVVAEGASLLALREEEAGLEEIFMRLTGRKADA